MKKKLLALFLVGCGLMARAQSTLLVVEQTDGRQSTFLLADKPVMTVSGADCVFKSEKAELSVARKDVKDFHFATDASAIETASAEGLSTKVIAPGVVSIKGVEPKDVSVFDLNGRAANADVQGTRESLTVSLAGQPKGVYIIKYSSYSLKIANK